MIIDTESHVLYRVWPIEANPNVSRVPRYTWQEHNGDLFVSEMDRAGVDKTFLISYDAEDIAWYFVKNNLGTHEDLIAGKKYTLAAIEKYPDRFLWFTTIKDPRRPENIASILDDFENGALGVKILPAFLSTPLPADDPALMDLYRLCVDHDKRVIIAFEETLPPVTPSVKEYFEQLDRVMTELPDLRVQVNHAGCLDPLRSEAQIIFDVTNRHENLFLSTAWLSMVWDDETEYPFPNYLKRVERLRDAVGIDKLMWATDWPWLDHLMLYPQAVDSIRRHATFMSEDEKRAFLGTNALRFLGEA